MFCEYCGSKMDDNADFCENCGRSVFESKSAGAGDIDDTVSVLDDGEPLFGDRTVSAEEVDPIDRLGEDTAEQPQAVLAFRREGADTADDADSDFADLEEPQRCSRCGAFVSPDTQFCDSCGSRVHGYAAEGAVQRKLPEHICRNCGQELAADAEFCDSCGAAVPESHSRSRKPAQSKAGAEQSTIGSLLTGAFSRPASAITLAGESENALAGAVFLLIKDVIIAAMAAVMIVNGVSELGFLRWIISGEEIWASAGIVFAASLVMDVLWICILCLCGKLFGGSGSLAAAIGAVGTGSLVLTVGLILSAVLLMLFSSDVLVFSVILCAAIFLAATVIITEKALHVSAEWLIYAVPVALLLYGVIIYFILNIIINGDWGSSYR